MEGEKGPVAGVERQDLRRRDYQGVAYGYSMHDGNGAGLLSD